MRTRRSLATRRRLFSELLESRQMMAVLSQALVSDIDSEVVGGQFNPQNVVSVGDNVFFTATTAKAGTELWVSNVTTGSTRMVRDLNVGQVGSNPRDLVNANGTLFFAANDGVTNSDLWKTDGTEAGTVRVSTTADFSNTTQLTNIGGTVYFSTFKDLSGELWKTDGTEGGTVRVSSASVGVYPSKITAVGSSIYFRGYDNTANYELWKTDGTTAGTARVRDIFPGGNTSYPDNLVNLNGTLLFTAANASGNNELWTSDGTFAGTVRVKDIQPGVTGSSPQQFNVFGGSLFFTAQTTANGQELWKSNGTDAGTVIVKDLTPGASGSSFTGFATLGSSLVFTASGNFSHNKLWKTDGTAAGTVEVLNPGSPNLYPSQLATAGSQVFFQGYSSSSGYELWKSDGTAAGTTIVKDIGLGNQPYGNSLRSLTNANGTLAFFRNNGTDYDVWKSDGSAAGTVLIGAAPSLTGDSSPKSFANLNGTLFFEADSDLYKSDGTVAGTVKLADNAYPSRLTQVGSVVFFRAYDAANGYELWKTDGTLAGTTMVRNIGSGGNSGDPDFLTNVNGKLFFTADNGSTGVELWASDGTFAGTAMVKNIGSGINGSNPNDLVNLNGTLVFTANDTVSGEELWKSDGTIAGTVAILDAPVSSYSPDGLTVMGNRVYFTAWNFAASSFDLWKSDGTPGGTVVVGRSGGPVMPLQITNVNGTLFFVGNDGSNAGPELWKSDGTTGGTVLVKNIDTRSYYSSYAEKLTNVNGTLYFLADDGVNGKELWKSDGTDAGTELVKDFNPGPGDGIIDDLTDFNGQLYFAASDATASKVLYTSDGTTAGTVRAATGGSGETPSEISNMLVAGTKLYFDGITNAAGRELFRVNVVAHAAADAAITNEDLAVTTVNVLLLDEFDGPATISAFDATSASGGTVAYNGDGTFNYSPAANFNGVDTFTYTLRDFDGETSVGTVTIIVSAINDAPTGINLSSNTILENQPIETVVGVLSTADVDTGDTFTYSLVAGTGDTDNAAFTISGNQLLTNAVFDFEVQDSYSILVRATDFANASFDAIFIITVDNVNEAPTLIGLSNNSIAENLAVNAVVGTLSTTDPDTGSTFTYTLVSGTGSDNNASFNISGNQLRASASFDYETKTSYTIRVRSTDNGSLPVEQVFTITIIDGNDAPVIGSFGAPLPYRENQAARTIGGAATVVDADSANFSGGVLTVSLSANGHANDRLEIRDRTGTPNRIGVTGSDVTYNSVVIGTFTGGVGTTPLAVNLNAGATQPIVQALLRALTYRTLGDAPSTLTRTISIALTDGDGGTSNTATKTITVETVNDRPVLALGGTTSYAENQAPRTLATTTTVSDPDHANFNTGYLNIRVSANANSNDRLAVANNGTGVGQIGVSGTNVTFGGTTIGTFTGGSGNQALVITFNANATILAVQALTQAITFQTLGDNPSTLQRTVSWQLKDQVDGAVSVTATKLVNVTATNDAPVLGGTASPLGYVRGAAAIIVASSFTITDPDSPNYDTGRLLVKVDSGASPTNRLEVGGPFSFAGDTLNYFNGSTTVAIGVRNTNGGVGNTNLNMTFNASATSTIVLQLLRNVRFRTDGATTTTQRIISFNLTDGDTGTSNTVTRTVNIT